MRCLQFHLLVRVCTTLFLSWQTAESCNSHVETCNSQVEVCKAHRIAPKNIPRGLHARPQAGLPAHTVIPFPLTFVHHRTNPRGRLGQPPASPQRCWNTAVRSGPREPPVCEGADGACAPVEDACVEGGAQHPSDKRHSRQQLDVLQRDPLAAAARQHQRGQMGARLRLIRLHAAFLWRAPPPRRAPRTPPGALRACWEV